MKAFNKEEMGKLAESVKNRVGEGSPAGNFFASMKNRMGIGSPERNATDTYERGMNIVPDCISANEHELPVKQYNIAVLRNLFKFERAEGRMQVTNKRVIFRAAGRSVGGRTTLQHEFAIGEIAGIEARNNYKFSFLYLVFAILIIAVATFIIYRPASISSILSPMELIDNSLSIMEPKHVQKAFANKDEAIAQRKQAGEKVELARDEREAAQKIVDRWTKERDEDILGNPNYTYRFRGQVFTAQAILDIVTPERDKLAEEEALAIAEAVSAQERLTIATKKATSVYNTWKVLMTLLGLILGAGALAAFFMLYKKFGLKLFILNFGIFGFVLSATASGLAIFTVLLALTIITTIVCIFLFCFRPNLVISVKNKGGTDGAIDVRRGKGTCFSEIIPTEEAEGAIREIGAMIGDIQKLGDSALGKWTKK